MKTERNRIPALLLAALILCGCLAGCSTTSRPSQPLPTPHVPAVSAEPEQPPTPQETTQTQTPAETEQPQTAPKTEPPQTPAETAKPADGEEPPAEPMTPASLYGLWLEDEGRAELWIQEVQGEDLLFSLYIPGSAGINNAWTRLGDDFLYQDPYLEGVGAAGSLRVENGVLTLIFGESRLEFGAGTVLRFSLRSDSPDYRYLYAPVIEAWQDFELEGGTMENWYADEPGYVHSGLYGANHFGYQFWDMDRDGSPEMIIGVIWPPEETAGDELGAGLYQHNLVLDLYTLVDNVPTYVVNSGDRYRYSLTSDGQIYYEGSSGAAYTDQATYILRNGALEMVNGISSEEGAWYKLEDGFNPNHEGYDPISEEEFRWLFDNFFDLYRYDRFAVLQLRPFLVSEA